MSEYVLTSWKIVPEKGGTVCLLGVRNSSEGEIQTTTLSEIKRVSDSSWAVRTRSGSIYVLNSEDKHPSMWQLALQCKRPDKYTALQNHGIVP